MYRRISTYLSRNAPWCHYVVAALLLASMFALGVGSMSHDTAIVDELAHIPAGYSYLRYGDYRLNPEHPPLIKDLAALPLQFMNLKFPKDDPAWTTEANGQWDAGWSFLYHLGNDASRILFWARLPILLLGVSFGGVFYGFVKRRWGVAAALVALFAYVFSPNILAHSHYVTTDLGAAIFMFLALMSFIRFVEKPSYRTIAVLSVGLAAAQLAKFSSVLLYPFLGAITVLIALAWDNWVGPWGRLRTYLGGLLLASLGSLVWIYLFYLPHVATMPAAVQERLVRASLMSGPGASLSGLIIAFGRSLWLRPLAQYLLGLCMVFGRLTGGNVTYFLGDVSDQSFKGYFPLLFVTKTQIPLLILLVAVIGMMLYATLRRPKHWFARWRHSLHDFFAEWLLGLFVVFYFLVAVVGNLDLGIRHILPIYPPLFALVAIGTVQLVRRYQVLTKSYLGPWAVVGLAAWYLGSVLWVYPSFLSYFNELIGGPANASSYFSDSSVDWGQDLARLKDYTDSHPEIHQLALDYFGGGLPEYYYCKRTYNAQGKLNTDPNAYDCSGSVYMPWHAQNGPYQGEWIAVSETFLENDRYYAKFYNRVGYDYLRAQVPVAKIGYSIYLYKLR